MNGLPCFDQTVRTTNKKLVNLVDTGAGKNYITEEQSKLGKLVKLKKPFFVKTIHGTEIRNYVIINLFSHDLKCYILDFLGNFDLIIGMDGLRKINAQIDLMSFQFTYTPRVKSESLHYTMQSNIDQNFQSKIAKLVEKNNDTPVLPFNTKIQAEIRTSTPEPIWTKQYAYPMSCNDFVNSGIEKLLKDGIIRPSYSPYNAPVWVVPKKGFNADGTPKKRLVIDYKKLNSFTIFDRYPMPDVNIILSNLGEAKFFSKIDLESGFHQILIKESDTHKTAFSVDGAMYEFTRMPFGLCNAPSLFQRAMDDVLRPFIGKFAYVYMDDVIIFSATEDQH